MRALKSGLVAIAISVCAFLPVGAQNEGFDEEAVALAFHKVSGEPLDLQEIALRSGTVQRSSGFDRPDVIKAEVARLQGLLDGASAAREFVISVNDSITQYDHDAGEFSVSLFTPGHYVPLQAFGRQYQLVFANADRARRMPMAREQARAFDARLTAMGRKVLNEIRFRVIGKRDPTGAVSGPLTIRAEIVSDRLLDASGNVVFTPDLKTASSAEINASQFDIAKADVAGLRVGVTAGDLEATLKRLYGPVKRVNVTQNATAKYAGSIGVNSSGCFSVYGRRGNPRPGTVCVEAFFDSNEIVRSVRIERYFPYFHPDVLEKALVKKYGPPSGYPMGWGPDVETGRKALTATYKQDNNVFTDGLNARPNVSVTLHLVDAAWVAANRSSGRSASGF